MPTPLDFGPFLALSEAARAELAVQARPISIPAGVALVREGDASDDVYAVTSGRLRIVVGPGERAVAQLAAPALVGEIAALERAPRTASVIARTPVRGLRIAGDLVRLAAAADERFAAELRAFADLRAVRTFLRRESPFAEMPSDAAAELAARLRLVRFADGEPLVREGERGDDVYLLRSGEAVVERGEPPEAIATMGAGALVGELSALTGAPRNATVRARGAVEAFRAAGDDVRAVLRRHRATIDRLEDAMRSRHAPRRTGDARVEDAPDDRGAVILHDERTGTYLRLSRDALAIYEALDGARTLRDLALIHFARTGSLDPRGVFDTVAALQAAGFASAPRIAADAPDARLMRLADVILAPRVEVSSGDRIAGALARALAPAFTPAGACVAIALGLVGLALLVRLFRLASPTTFGIAGLAVAFVGILIAGLGHEAAHAIATKVEGRRVGRAGIGLLWFTPVIYVDTSDAWLLDRRRRALINIVGPLFNFAAAGVFAIAATYARGGAQDLLIWLAFINLVSVAFNLSPLLEFDGYYALSDLTGTNALRRKALRFVFRDLVDRPRRPRTRAEAGFLAFAVAALVYVLAVSGVVLLGVPAVVDGLLASTVADGTRVLAGTAIALVLTALLVGPFVAEVFAVRSEGAG
ncbi:MAG TPA: cyclic nucleotide-binding domain-containing protein [Candidatus Limnocylindria bacterium]|nr:cyclic nucleotide-binding domain-containing protein [Candidatus Limnocylindria bacterium]